MNVQISNAQSAIVLFFLTELQTEMAQVPQDTQVGSGKLRSESFS